MHFPTTLLLYILNVSFSVSQRLESAAKVSETPSPEWIKYQKERFEHNSNAPVFQDMKKAQQMIMNNNSPQEPINPQNEVHLKHQDITDTTSRHSGNYDNHHQQQQSEFDNTHKTNSEDTSTNIVQFPSVQGFVEFLKSLKQTWMKNSIFRIEDKIKLLQNLKDSLLKTIEKQFMVLWQDDENENEDDHHHHVDVKPNANNPNQHLRSKRGILDESNINFPPYAALMSINFLTFSVFLIKLVLVCFLVLFYVYHFNPKHNLASGQHYQEQTLSTLSIQYGGHWSDKE